MNMNLTGILIKFFFKYLCKVGTVPAMFEASYVDLIPSNIVELNEQHCK